MKYTLDLSEYDKKGNPGINRFDGLFSSIEDAVKRGRDEARGRLHFNPKIVWIRDEEGETVRRDKVAAQ